MKRTRKRRKRTPEQNARYKAVRERFQKERPSKEDLLKSGDVKEFVPLGEYLKKEGEKDMQKSKDI